MKRLVIIILVFFIGFSGMGQLKCGSSDYFEYQMANNPEFAKNHKLLEKITQDHIKNNLASKSTSDEIVYTIPVVPVAQLPQI